METNRQMQLGRAKNAALSFMERRLSVPKIYIDAFWDDHYVDVLAIDRDGVGDVHAIRLFERQYTADGRLDVDHQEGSVAALFSQLNKIPANYRYIAAVDVDAGPPVAMFRASSVEELTSPDGIGRIGLLHIDATVEGDPEVLLRLKPERFRAKIAKLADEYVQQHEADWEIRA